MGLQSIAASLAAALAGINGQAPYSVAVVTVNGKTVNHLVQSSALMPSLDVVVQHEDVTDPEDVSQITSRANGEIIGFVTPTKDPTTGETVSPLVALAPLRDDVFTAIKAWRRAGQIEFTFKSVDYGEAESGDGLGMRIGFVVEFAETS